MNLFLPHNLHIKIITKVPKWFGCIAAVVWGHLPSTCHGASGLSEVKDHMGVMAILVSVIAVIVLFVIVLRYQVKKRTRQLLDQTRILEAEIGHRKKAENALKENEAKYRGLVEDTPIMICRSHLSGEITFVNKAYCEAFGKTAASLVGTSFFDLIPSSERQWVKKHFTAIRYPESVQTIEHPVITVDGSVRWQRWVNRGVFDDDGRMVGFQAVGEDVTQRRHYTAEQEITLHLLQSMDRTTDLTGLIRDVTTLMKHWSGCEAVGIRLQEGEDFPYYETHGFPETFVKAERRLCARDSKGRILRDPTGNPVLECMCGNVICGRFDSSLPFFTENGSFWTNSTTDLLASTTEADRQSRTRNRCHGEGYESVALIPLRVGERRIGLLQFNDTRRDRFDIQKIVLLEQLAASLTLGLNQRITEKDLQESENRYKAIFNQAGDGILLIHSETAEFIEFNTKAHENLGYTREEFSKLKVQDIEYVESPEHVAAHLKKVMDTGSDLFETRHRTKTGEIRDVLVTCSRLALHNGSHFLSIFRDITAQKQAEATLRAERDLLRGIAETSPAGITRVDNRGNIVYANHRAEAILGLSRSAISNRTYRDPEWKITDFNGTPFPEDQLPFFRVRQTKKTVYDVRHAITWPDGKRVLLSVNAAPILDASGAFDGIVATLNDITKIYFTERNYTMLFNEMIDGCALHEIICDGNGRPVDYRFLAVNPAFERLTGLKGDVITGKTVLEVMPNTESRWIDIYGKVALGGEPVEFENYSRELDRHFHVTAFCPLRGRFACIFVDTTKIKEMENRLRQAQRMESIGNMAGGIAHDFNNILFPIVGTAEMLLEDLAKHTPEWENAMEIYKAGKRGSDLVKQILSFSHQTKHKKIPIRIQQVVKEVLQLARKAIPVDIGIIETIQQNCGMVMADPTQIHQIIMNLVTNAFHAMEHTGGTISVSLAEVQSTVDEVDIDLSGGCILITIGDTGQGIAPDILDKIFEPYFTTKPQGKGTGLGLAVVYGIVREHGGDVTVKSELRKGTLFSVYLPVLRQPAEAVSEAVSEKDPSGTEHILLVDDEAPIVRLGKMILERLGYRVSSYLSSAAALAAFVQSPEDFDLVVTDMTMPGMTGISLAGEMLAIRKDIPIIICTGFSERIDNARIESIGVKGLLMKPIVKSELARMVRHVLDERYAGSNKKSPTNNDGPS